jgi:predicted transcriptional regulator
LNEKNVVNKEFSATSLAKELNMTLQSIIQMLLDMGLITRKGKVWELTPTGLSRGGKYKDSAQTGRYIVWPKSIIAELDDSNEPAG